MLLTDNNPLMTLLLDNEKVIKVSSRLCGVTAFTFRHDYFENLLYYIHQVSTLSLF